MKKQPIQPRNGQAARPEKGRCLFYTRDSGGEHETTPGEYVRRAIAFCHEHGLSFNGTPAIIQSMIRDGEPVHGDLFLDWDITGNQLTRPALDAMFDEIARDRSVSHVWIPRPDRLARPDEIEQGLALEKKFRREFGVTLVFHNRVCKPLKRGEKMELGEWLRAAIDYDRAEQERRDLAQKIINSQCFLARNGFSTGGRACYGFQRWLVGPDQKPIRPLEDGETVRRSGYHVVHLPKDDGTFEVRLEILKRLCTEPAQRIAADFNRRNKVQMTVPPPD